MLGLILNLAGAAVAAPPARVMSLNVCTDQLAMLLAAPGQLVSVSELASDPGLSFHSALAASYPHNRGLAEEVLVAKPDVVITGAYSLHNTTPLLRRLGYRIEEFQYSQTLDTIPGEIRRMGAILGATARAEEMATSFETELSGIEAGRCGTPPTAIAYDQNGIAMGAGSLVDSAMQAAGLRNIAAELGYSGMAPFPLELLVEKKPDIVVLPEPLADTPALADLIASHPAIRALGQGTLRIHLPRGSASCGGPFVIEAVKALVEARRRVVSCPAGGAAP
ncbi:ABC transporter substrate-binding protein [Mesorhizobium australicum]|uniref:Iron complex transport system substrate-binding protein n=1 Tax=Mesorhizobium australicum TaxID=536018 RepID=A0A1X7P0T4_9HYPH|nr:ABC transporter substrate-binding protein [Mesorhizobium australicum]SMH43308.1 iron complex transport system substrate-binding protein [Mesorhizobium australicum]